KQLQIQDAEAADVFPTQLPPLRGDAPTLVVGRTKAAGPLAYTIEGSVAGKAGRISKQEELPEAELDNFFLASMLKQWQSAKDQPALTRADRALAFAFEHNQLKRADLLTQAEWALSEDKLDAAAKLFNEACDLDPNDVEAKAGTDLVQKL